MSGGNFGNRNNNNFGNRDNNFGNNRGNFNQNRGGNFGNNNFRGRNNDNGGFNNNNGQGRFNKFQGGNGNGNRFQGRNNNNNQDMSRSRTRDKSDNFRANFKFGGQRSQDGENRGGPRPPLQRKGDWTCPECQNTNYAIRTHCNRCNIEKPQDLMQQDEERKNGAPTFKKGDWNCPSCKNLNFAKRQECNRCGEERPPETLEDYKPGRRGDMKLEDYSEFNMNGDEGQDQQETNGGDMEEGEVGVWN